MTQTFKKEDTFFSFMKKRVARIYPPYIIISFPMIVFFSFQSGSVIYFFHSAFIIPWNDWLSNSVSQKTRYSIANPVTWTIFYEFYFYLIFSIAKAVFPREKTKVVMLSSIMIFCGIFATWAVLGPRKSPGYLAVTWREIAGNLCLLPFVFGMFGSLIIRSKNKASWVCFLVIPASTVLIKLSHGLSDNYQIIQFISSDIPCSLLLVYMAKTERFEGYIYEKLHSVGIYSYSLYLFHANFYLLMGKINDKFKVGNFPQILISLVFIVTSIYISKWLNLHVERRFFIKNKITKNVPNSI